MQIIPNLPCVVVFLLGASLLQLDTISGEISFQARVKALQCTFVQHIFQLLEWPVELSQLILQFLAFQGMVLVSKVLDSQSVSSLTIPHHYKFMSGKTI